MSPVKGHNMHPVDDYIRSLRDNAKKDHFKYWRHRKFVAIFGLIASALTTNSFNTSTILIWCVGVALPIAILFFTSNDGDEMEILEDTVLTVLDVISAQLAKLRVW